MSRRINSTGRKKLTRDCVRIHMHEGIAGAAQSFTAELNIPVKLHLAPQARVYIEAYVKSSAMRFSFGTVAAITHPSDCILNDIDAGTPVLFRIKIADETEHVGRILAAAHGIRPEGDKEGANRISLLPLWGTDLDEEVWRLVFDKDAGPTLAVNNRIPGLMERLPSDMQLMAVIFPEVVRQMARRIWTAGGEQDELADWVINWKKWLVEQLGREPRADELSDPEGVDDLGDEVARSFATRQKYASFVARLSGEEQS